MNRILLSALPLALAACSAKPDQISPIYVAPEVYAGQSCEQLQATRDQLHLDLTAANRRFTETAKHDTGGLIMWGVFYEPEAPAQAPRIASLKGNLQAVNGAAGKQGCKLPPAPEVPEVAAE